MRTNKSRFTFLSKKLLEIQKRMPFVLIILAVFVGGITGLIGSFFQLALRYILNWPQKLLQIRFEFDSFSYVLPFIIAAGMGAFSFFLVKRIAPESSGSGIPEVEGALLDLRPVRWWRVLPVKFFGGLAALGSGMILGREGPTVQMGANSGKMISDAFKIKDKDSEHMLISTGAGAGITTAFNAPLGGILFVFEEMRAEFTYTKTAVLAVFIGCVSAAITYHLIIGGAPILGITSVHVVQLNSLWLFIILGILLGIIGSCSNSLILFIRSYLEAFYKKNKYYFVLIGALLAGIFGLLFAFNPTFAGDGFTIIPKVIEGLYGFYPLLLILLFRFFATIICFGSGAPGGIFSPTMALGAILGVLFGFLVQEFLPHYEIEFATYAILAMAGLFAATLRAPLTGIVIIMEMTNAYVLILPLIITCTAATLMAQLLGSSPLYAAILELTLKNQKKDNLKS